MSRAPFAQQFDQLHAAASDMAGLTEFGPCDYETGLRVLLAAIDQGPPLNESAYANARNVCIRALAARLATQAGWNANPQVLGRGLERPVIIIGLPRTGTTALHELLSLDPQFQGLEHWLRPAPMPRPPRAAWETHPLYQRAVQAIAEYRMAAPALAAAHRVEPWDYDECIWITAQTFCSNFFGENLEVPDYDAWFLRQDETPVFRRHADVLNLIGRDDPRRWLLKNCSHLMGAEALIEAFPDACLIWTHRHPNQAIASMVSLIGGLRDLRNGRAMDRAILQQREIMFWSEAGRRGMAAEARHPGRFVNVRQEEIRMDPLGVVDRIYRSFGLALSPEAQAAMAAFARANPPDGRSGHAYASLDGDPAVQAAFADYIDHYDLERPFKANRAI